MLSQDDILGLIRRKYPAFLRSIITSEGFFPHVIRFGRPATTDDWGKLSTDIEELANGRLGYRIDWTEINTRTWGRQRFPSRVWFEDEASFVSALGKGAEVALFRANLGYTRTICPQLEAWLPANVRLLLEYADVWQDILKVCTYFQANPVPRKYARELPIAVDTKFIDRNQGVLGNLLAFLLKVNATGNARFEERFGLLYDEPLIRIRILDESIRDELRQALVDFSVPLSLCAQFNWRDLTVVVTENKMNFLTLPRQERTIGIWGGGYAAALLARIPWLQQCSIHYWGDIDEHGFHILAKLRSVFPRASSVMMDAETLCDYAGLATQGAPVEPFDPSLLRPAERDAYEAVRTGCLRLEQEKIPHADAVARLTAGIRSCVLK